MILDGCASEDVYTKDVYYVVDFAAGHDVIFIIIEYGVQLSHIIFFP